MEFEEYAKKAVLPRGDTAADKITNLIAKYQKIIKDCENDPSDYRKRFSECHADVVTTMLQPKFDRVKLEELISSVGVCCAILLGQKRLSEKSNAEMDASGLIATELGYIRDSHVYF